jgi:hypothetical protein
MKTRIIMTLCMAAFLFASVNPSAAASRRDPAYVATDALIVRPLCFAATIIGSVFFVISLPIAATSGSVHSTADALVVTPAHATFTRPLGDFNELLDF